MKVAQLLREADDSEVFHVGKRSEINRGVAAMSMAVSIDVAIEHHPSRDGRNASTDQIDEEYLAIKTILKKHTKTKPGGLGSALVTGRFDHKNQLEQLKAALEDIADEFDPANEDKPWPWLVSLEDEAWLFS